MHLWDGRKKVLRTCNHKIQNKANPKKVKSLLEMRSQKIVKEVQALNGKLAAIGRFLAKSLEKHSPSTKH